MGIARFKANLSHTLFVKAHSWLVLAIFCDNVIKILDVCFYTKTINLVIFPLYIHTYFGIVDA